jgi:hypothetical protein
MLSEFEKKVLRLLNDDEYTEALYEFRRHHKMVNNWVCGDCGLVSNSTSSNGCNNCGSINVHARVVKEANNA